MAHSIDSNRCGILIALIVPAHGHELIRNFADNCYFWRCSSRCERERSSVKMGMRAIVSESLPIVFLAKANPTVPANLE